MQPRIAADRNAEQAMQRHTERTHRLRQRHAIGRDSGALRQRQVEPVDADARNGRPLVTHAAEGLNVEAGIASEFVVKPAHPRAEALDRERLRPHATTRRQIAP